METEAELPPPGEGKPVTGVLLPHAGYLFSMPTALRTLREASEGAFRRAVILAPSHRVAFEGAALAEDDVLRTPFGDLAVDRKGAETLLRLDPEDFAVREDAHREEHAVEVELPLLQYFFRDLTVLPVVFGRMDWEGIRRTSEALAEIADGETLWVISSDFTHYGRDFGYVPFEDKVPERLKKLDLEAADCICRGDASGFARFFQRTRATICGMFPVLTWLETARLFRGNPVAGELTEYRNSGEMTGDWSRAVGYAGVVFR